jgi:hypothetical protein
MRRLVSIVAVLVVSIVGCGGVRAASPRAPSATTQEIGTGGVRARSILDILGPHGQHQTPAQLADIAALIRRWEQDPYGPLPENDTTMSTPAVMLVWLVESPDVSVTACMAVQVLAEGHGADVGPVVTMGSTFGMAAYLIEHPGARSTSAEVQVGGVESALRWYAAARRRGDAANEVLEELVARHAQSGTAGLLAWWSEHGIRCGDG